MNFIRNKYFLIALTLLMAGLAGITIVSNSFIKTKGYKNLSQFIVIASRNFFNSRDATIETISLEISKENFEKLERLRQIALDRGIQINEGDNYVAAVLKFHGKKIKAEVRLKGHMTDHLQKNKWSFRVKTKKGDTLMGMKRFSLQHPGTRNYVHEWLYHRMIKREGIIALRYFFIRLIVNGNDWGIYALEENFGEELLAHNERMKGPIFRFNPDLYWQGRIRQLKGIALDDNLMQMQSAYIDPFESKNILSDSSLLKNFLAALFLMEDFRRGKKTTHEVFDTGKLAKFHAIIDLVGGHRSLDWSDVKYYYNPATQLIEPVAYESFNGEVTSLLCGSFRFTGDTVQSPDDLHSMIFNDVLFFRKYIQELERIASETWLDDFFNDANSGLEKNLAILYREFPYKNFDKSFYYNNARNIRMLLSPPKAFHAFLKKLSVDSVVISIGGISPLPVEINSLVFNEQEKLKLPEEIIIPCKQPEAPVYFKDYFFRIPRDMTNGFTHDKFKFEYIIPGCSDIKVDEVFPYAFNQSLN